jgi:hypothetical protein
MAPGCTHRVRSRRWFALAAWAAAGALCGEPLPLFDAHLHYNAEAAARWPAPAAVDILRRNGVRGALVSSTPNEGTLALEKAASASVKVVRFIRPYRNEADRATWFRDPAILAMLQTELERGDYRGIGELHLHGEDAANVVLRSVVDLAASRSLYLLAHCDQRALDLILAHQPDAKLIWAHSGFTVPPEELALALERHPTLLLELSYRSDIAAGGHLASAWRTLLLRFPDRFLIGSDTWTNERWQGYGELIAGYRGWLGELPAEVAEAIAWRNADARLAP